MQKILLTGIQKLALCISFVFLMGAGVSIFQQEIQQVYAATTTAIDTEFPTRAKPNATEDITDLNYWRETLPVQDQSAAGFVVYPKAGVTIPLVRPNQDDLEKIKVGDLFNHFKYLENGALHYVGNAPDQGIGNMVLAAHSSFNENDPGRYKTVGQVAPLSEVGDKIFVYLANDQGEYTLYVYTIQISEQIPATQVSILNQQVQEKTLTFFTCFPIGTTIDRWVNTAALTETISEENWHVPVPISETQKSTPVFSTQSITTKTAATVPTSQEHGSAPVQKTAQPKIKKISPTFKERVLYRPVVYRTAIKLVSSVGFKRSNLQKLIDLIDQKVDSLQPDETSATKNKKLIVIFMLIKELVEGFMK